MDNEHINNENPFYKRYIHSKDELIRGTLETKSWYINMVYMNRFFVAFSLTKEKEIIKGKRTNHITIEEAERIVGREYPYSDYEYKKVYWIIDFSDAYNIFYDIM